MTIHMRSIPYRLAFFIAFTFSTLFSCGPYGSSWEDHAGWVRFHYDKQEYMVPMRDGVELFTIVYTPNNKKEALPILLYRTPYSIAPYGSDEFRDVLGPSPEFDRDGYIFAFQDVRGKFKSEGEFAVIRPLAPKPKGATDVDESTDNFDTIEWLLANTEGNNGRVGQWGISYSGWQTLMGMVDAHPALAASSPQASPSDMFIGDDWHHNGAFRIMYAFSWLSRNARRRDAPTEERAGPFDYGTPSGYDFFLDAGAAARIDELYFHGDVLAWNDFMEHGNYDYYWQRQNALQHLHGIDHATLNVAGWFDTEDFYGPMSIYHTIEEKNPGIENTLTAGPWLHGGWRSMEGDHLGCVEFDSKTSLYFQREVQFPFFQHHLKEKGDWEALEAVVFETGSNEWKRYDSWPPEDLENTKLLFAGRRKTILRGADRLRRRFLRERSKQTSTLLRRDPNHAGPFVEGGGSTIRVNAPGCAGLRVRRSGKGSHHRRSDPREHFRIDHRNGIRLDRQIDRRLSRRCTCQHLLRYTDGWFPNAPRRGDHAGAVSKQSRGSAADEAWRSHADCHRSSRPLSHLQGRAQHYGPHSELVVPGLRPEPSNLRRHLPGPTGGLPIRDPDGLSLGPVPLSPRFRSAALRHLPPTERVETFAGFHD